MQTVDLMLHAGWVIPVDDSQHEPQAVLADHTVVVDKGRILSILPSAQAINHYTADESIDLPGHALLPGLINSHTHAAMSLFRGLADDMPLMQWLNDHIWPAEGRWVNEEFVADGSRLAIAEMLRSGTTCFNDMYFFPDVTAQVAAQAGIRASVGLIVIDFPSAWATDQNDYFDKGLKVHDQYRDHPLIHTAFAPHAPYSVSNEPLKRVQMLANELDLPVHMHVHETTDEIRLGEVNHGQRPIARLDGLGMLSPALVAVHMTQLEDDEIERVAQAGVNVVHCPQSNLKLASGFCPVKRLLDAEVNVALGTDSAASNNNLNLFEEMQTAALLAKGVSGDASALPAWQALQMATINGAKALGLASETGSLSTGKSADIIAVKLDAIETQPVYNPISQVVYACLANQVTDSWIGGRQVMKNRRLTLMDEEAILSRAKGWRERILDRTE